MRNNNTFFVGRKKEQIAAEGWNYEDVAAVSQRFLLLLLLLLFLLLLLLVVVVSMTLYLVAALFLGEESGK